MATSHGKDRELIAQAISDHSRSLLADHLLDVTSSDQHTVKSAAVLIPPAFGLAGVNLHIWTGWGSVTNWNAFVANLEMHGKGTFFDPRLNDPNDPVFPVAARAGFDNVRNTPDLITAKLPALHFYQLALPAPIPPEGSFDQNAAHRGKQVFENNGRCATCQSRRSTLNRAGTCTRQKRSTSTTSKPSAHPTRGTARLP
jgi:hypothetical protein